MCPSRWQNQSGMHSLKTYKFVVFYCQKEGECIGGMFIVGFEVLTAVSTKMAVFRVVAPCSLLEV
jgi:hypothetical protein